MKARMRIGELLVRSELVTKEQVNAALARQAELGGRLGEILVAMNALRQETLDVFLNRIPQEPVRLESTGIDTSELLTVMLKAIYKGRLESVRQYVQACKLPLSLVLALVKMAVDRKLLVAMGIRVTYNPQDTTYTFTEEGKRWVQDALDQNRYSGPAPVTLEEFCEQVNLQKFTNDFVTLDRVKAAFEGLTFEESIFEQAGLALNSGRAILLYGPSGNGKTTVALRMASIFSDVIYVPYAVTIDGQIIVVYDPTVHTQVDITTPVEEDSFLASNPEDNFDQRWVPCKRPFVISGGELTLDMFDLRYDPTTRFYEAPMHMKVSGGCYVVDDFGRQQVGPLKLLNRWIVPLENRIDFLKLHTGKTFSIPFDELVIFSTNLDPESFIDPAFLRRLPYKIEVSGPSLELYKQIFQKECEAVRMTLPDEEFRYIISEITTKRGMKLAGFQPKFLIDQVLAFCRFLGQPPRLEARNIEHAINNLAVRRSPGTTSYSPEA